MKHEEQVYNWLAIGLKQSPARFSETFYYDKDCNELFSIMRLDYLLFDENFDLDDTVASNYTKEALLQLEDKIKKVKVDKTAIALPRLGISEIDYLQEANKFLENNRINLQDVKIWNPGDGDSISFPVK